MRKVYLENLPHRGKLIDWKNSISCYINFVYDNIEGIIKILSYDHDKLTIQYKNKSIEINRTNFIKCCIGELLGTRTKQYKYTIGDIVETNNNGKLKILEQIRKNNHKYYEYVCLHCGYIGNISEGHINDGEGCSVCRPASHKVVKGINDIGTTNPELAKLLANPEDGYKYTYGSDTKVDWKCPDCGNIIKNKSISQINKVGLSCPKCSDGISYPEKIMFNIFKQLNINFQTQLSKTTFKWCKGNEYDVKYDFYIPSINCIIETHGLQHYEEGFLEIKGRRTLQEEQENDKFKEQLAINNNIINYIIIDSRISDLTYIKNNILNSKINDFFNLSEINWELANEESQKSFVRKVCDLWNSGITNNQRISENLKLSITTIIKYLKIGNDCGWCKYNANNRLCNCTKIICITTNEIFDSMKQAENKYHIHHSNIIRCINHKCKSAGKFNNNKLVWMYLEDYKKQNNVA